MNRFKCLRRTRQPSRRPPSRSGVVLILQSIIELRTYDLIYVLTRGGPGSSTDLPAYFVCRTAFRGLDLARASAMSYLLLVMTMVLVVSYYRRVFREAGA